METDSEEVEKVLQSLANDSNSFHTSDDTDADSSKVEELLRQIEQEKETPGDEHAHAPSSMDDGNGDGDGDVVVSKPPIARAKKMNGKLGDKPAAPTRKKSPPRDEIPKPWKKKGAIRKKPDNDDGDIFMISAKEPPPSLQDTPQASDDAIQTFSVEPKHEFAPSSTLSRTPPESPSSSVRVQPSRDPTTPNGIPHTDFTNEQIPSSPKQEIPTSSTPPPSSPTPQFPSSQAVHTPKQQLDNEPIRQATPPPTITLSSTPPRSSPRSTPTPPPSSNTPPRTASPHPQESQPPLPSKPKKISQPAEDMLLDDTVSVETPVFSKNDFAELKNQILKQVAEETAILAQEFQELKTKYDEEIRGKSRLKAVLNDYEKTIAKLIDDASSGHHEGLADRVNELENENKRKTEEYDAIASAHNELKSRYESIKADNEKFKSNEQVQKEMISKLQNELQGSETRFHALKTHAETKLDSAHEQLVKLRDERAKEVAVLQTRMQKAETKSAGLEKENKELLAIADDLMAKLEQKNQ